MTVSLSSPREPVARARRRIQETPNSRPHQSASLAELLTSTFHGLSEGTIKGATDEYAVTTPTTAEHRIPSTIWEAECSHSDCADPSQPDGARNNAVPIYQNVLLLNRRREENCYVASFRMVSVGCTCVRPEIV
ncbi:unnamed protein product [Lota lota]